MFLLKCRVNAECRMKLKTGSWNWVGNVKRGKNTSQSKKKLKGKNLAKISRWLAKWIKQLAKRMLPKTAFICWVEHFEKLMTKIAQSMLKLLDCENDKYKWTQSIYCLYLFYSQAIASQSERVIGWPQAETVLFSHFWWAELKETVYVQKFFGCANHCFSNCRGGWSQTFLEVNMLDVEVLGCCGYMWSTTVRMVGYTAKFSEMLLEVTYARGMNIHKWSELV